MATRSRKRCPRLGPRQGALHRRSRGPGGGQSTGCRQLRVAALNRTTYYQVLDRVLAQARLVLRNRLDEAGRPFLWITR